MKPSLFLLLIALTAASLNAADPKENVVGAAKALAGKPNYSWTTTSKNDGGGNFRIGPTNGKTEKDGLTYVTMSFNDNEMAALSKGEKVAIKGEDGWKGGDELTEGRGSFMARRFKNYKGPALEAQDIAAGTKELKESDGVISGDLTEDGAKALMSFGRRGGGNGPEISGAKGKAKFWVKDVVLAKYEFHVEGKMSGQNGDIEINRTTTVEIKDVGTTKVDAPEEARKKLS